MLAGVVALAALVSASAAHAQDDPTVAPNTVLGGDGRSATDGRRTLAVTQAAGLDPAGQTIGVSGSGYDCLLYTSPSPRDISGSRMPSSA